MPVVKVRFYVKGNQRLRTWRRLFCISVHSGVGMARKLPYHRQTQMCNLKRPPEGTVAAMPVRPGNVCLGC